MKITLYNSKKQALNEAHTIYDELVCIYQRNTVSEKTKALIYMMLSGQYRDFEYVRIKKYQDHIHRLTFREPSKITIHTSFKKIDKFINKFNEISEKIVTDANLNALKFMLSKKTINKEDLN